MQRHSLLQVRPENDGYVATCTCGEKVRHSSRLIVQALQSEHALREWEKRPVRA